VNKEVSVNWKIRVERGTIEVEVAGMNCEDTKKLFDEVAKKYLGE